MSAPSDVENLLRDVLAEEAAGRDALLDQFLRLGRRRRLLRRARAGLVCFSILIIGFVGLRWLIPDPLPTVVELEVVKPYQVVATRPFPGGILVQSRSLGAASVVNSTAGVEVITTALSGFRAREIEDKELLELAAPNTAVLVRSSLHEAELVFVGQDKPE